MSEILARLVLRNEHLRKPHDKQIVTAKYRGNCREKCTMLSKRDYAQMEWTLRGEGPKTLCWYRAVTGKSAKFVQDFDLFVTVLFLCETPAVPLLHILCSKHGYSFVWKSVKLHDWIIIGSQLLVQWTTSYFLSFQNCHLFQQQFVFKIEINRSVKLFQKIGIIVRSSHDSK